MNPQLDTILPSKEPYPEKVTGYEREGKIVQKEADWSSVES